RAPEQRLPAIVRGAQSPPAGSSARSAGLAFSPWRAPGSAATLGLGEHRHTRSRRMAGPARTTRAPAADPAHDRRDRVQAQVRGLVARVPLVGGEAALDVRRPVRDLRAVLQAQCRVLALSALPAHRDRAVELLLRRDRARNDLARGPFLLAPEDG